VPCVGSDREAPLAAVAGGLGGAYWLCGPSKPGPGAGEAAGAGIDLTMRIE